MWLACDHDCTDSLGNAWAAGVPAEVSTEEAASLLAIPGGGFSVTGEPEAGPPEPGAGEGTVTPAKPPARRKTAPKEAGTA